MFIVSLEGFRVIICQFQQEVQCGLDGEMMKSENNSQKLRKSKPESSADDAFTGAVKQVNLSSFNPYKFRFYYYTIIFSSFLIHEVKKYAYLGTYGYIIHEKNLFILKLLKLERKTKKNLNCRTLLLFFFSGNKNCNHHRFWSTCSFY